MSKVFTSEGTGAAVYVFSDDHCPPHIHARHRGDGWTARVSFSYLTSVADLMSIEPVKRAPSQRTVNCLLDEIQHELPRCRKSWWLTRRTTCLENQWVLVGAPGRMTLSDHVPGARQVSDAEYDPSSEQVRVIFRDGKTEEMRLCR